MSKQPSHWEYDPPKRKRTKDWARGLSYWVDRWTPYGMSPYDLQTVTPKRLASVMRVIHRSDLIARA